MKLNRREFVLSGVATAGVGAIVDDVTFADPQPNDVIILRLSHPANEPQLAILREYLDKNIDDLGCLFAIILPPMMDMEFVEIDKAIAELQELKARKSKEI